MSKGSVSAAARRADRIARTLEADTYANIGLGLNNPRAYANLVVDLDDTVTDEREFSEALRRSLTPLEFALLVEFSERDRMTFGEDAVQVARWSRTRIVYTVDQDLADAVLSTDWADTVIPGEVLARLPHPNPMVVLPTPLVLPSATGLAERYEAFIVLGIRPPRRRCSSTDPRVNELVLHFLGRQLDERGDVVEYHVPSMLNPNGGVRSVPGILGNRVVTPVADLTMREREAIAVMDMRVTSANGSDIDAAALQVLTRTGLGLLTYLATDDVDTRPVPGVKGKRRPHGHGRDREENTVIEVGYRVGAALRAARAADHSTAGPGETRTVSPHIRRAHFHTYWAGRGRMERRVKWLPPIPVNWDHPPEVTTVHHR